MSREVPLFENAVCDECGAVGAYDFMGDYLCPACASKAVEAGERKMKLTLTKMLEEDMLDPYPKPDCIDIVRRIFKEWLRTVGLPKYLTSGRDTLIFDATESLRDLLILLVDEP